MTTQSITETGATRELAKIMRYVNYMKKHTHSKYTNISGYTAGDLDPDTLIMKRRYLQHDAYIQVVGNQVFLVEKELM